MRLIASARGRGSSISTVSLQPSRPAREHQHAVGQEHRLVDLVGDEQHGLAALLPDAHQLGLHDLAGLRVERRERLVHQQDFRVDRERAGEVDALAHAAGQLARIVVLEAVEPDQLEQLHGAPPLDRADLAGDLGPDDGVGEHRAPRQQAVALEHEAAVAAGTVQRAAVEQQLAGARGLEARDDAQERGLAAARSGRPPR